MDVRESYDSAADAYTSHLAAELGRKPLDRHLLNRFAEGVRGRCLVADLGCGPGHVAKYIHDRGVSGAATCWRRPFDLQPPAGGGIMSGTR